MAYGIQTHGDSFTAVSVMPLAEGRWRIVDLEGGALEQGPSRRMREGLGSKGSPVAVVAPGSSVNNALTGLPRLKSKEMDLAVKGWVAREEGTLADAWRVTWGEHKRPEPNPERKDVFILYAPEEEMQSLHTRVRGWSAEPGWMLPDYTVLDKMFRLKGPDHEDLAGWNLVFVSEEDHFLCVSTREGMLLTRELPSDLSGGANPDEHIQRLATEVDRSLFFARQTEFNPRIDRIVVCGDPRLATALVARLEDETSVAVQYWDLGQIFEAASGVPSAGALLPAMAAALATETSNLNLLPATPRSLLSPLLRRRVGLAAATAAWALVPLLTVGGLLTSQIQDRYLGEADRRMQEALLRAEEAKDVYRAEKLLQDREKHIAEATSQRRDYAGVLLHLASLTPEEIIFKNLRLEEGTGTRPNLYLAGESRSDLVEEAQQAFITFQQALENSALLTPVGEPRKLVIDVDREDGKVRQKVEFNMQYGIENPGKTGREASALALQEGR